MSLAIVSANQLLRGLLRTQCEQAELRPVSDFGAPAELPAALDASIILLHVASADTEALDWVRDAGRLFPRAQVVLFGPEDMVETLAARADIEVAATVSEAKSVEELITVLKVVEAGFRILPIDPARPLDHARQPGAPSKAADDTRTGELRGRYALSDRELAILGLLRDGLSNKDIANALGIVESTVKVHLRSCYNKLRTKNRTQAAIWAAQHLGEGPTKHVAGR